MSTEHDCTVIVVGEIRPHPNANALELTDVFGRQIVIGRGQWRAGDLAVYVPADSIVDVTRSEFAFLAANAKGKPAYRIRPVRLRGEPSCGILVPAPPGSGPGDNVGAALGVAVWDGETTSSALHIAGDAVYHPILSRMAKYDVEGWGRNKALFQKQLDDGHPDYDVVLTEKIHGCNMRIARIDNQIWVGSRNLWLKEDPNNVFWGLVKRLKLDEKLSYSGFTRSDGFVVYLEAYGSRLQDLSYGETEPQCAILDVELIGRCHECHQDRRSWVHYDAVAELAASLGVRRAPEIMRLPLSRALDLSTDTLDEMCASSRIANNDGRKHMGEGVVIRSVAPRQHPKIGNVILKHVAAHFLSR